MASPDAIPKPTLVEMQPRVSLEVLKKNEMYVTMVGRIDHISTFVTSKLPSSAGGLSECAISFRCVGAGDRPCSYICNADTKQRSCTRHALGAFISYSMVAIALVTTLGSTLNSVMRPALQYGHYVRYINKFWGIRSKLDFDLEEVLISQDESPCR